MSIAINAADLKQNLEVLLCGEVKMFVIQKFQWSGSTLLARCVILLSHYAFITLAYSAVPRCDGGTFAVSNILIFERLNSTDLNVLIMPFSKTTVCEKCACFSLPVELLRLLENKCSNFLHLFSIIQNTGISIMHQFGITYNESDNTVPIIVIDSS